MFGLTELKKGYFPHFFNTSNNQNYKGKLPHKKYYGYKTMSVDGKAKFEERYEANKNSRFDFRKEMREYCRSDVDILKRSCIVFRQQFLDVSNVDPFQYITIASVCLNIFKNQHLKKATIAISDHINFRSTSK